MSMLTPPGMGGKYRITGNRYPRMRRPRGHHKIALAGVGATLALGLVGWGTWQLIDVFSGDSGTKSSATGRNASGDCARKPGGDGADTPSKAAKASASSRAGTVPGKPGKPGAALPKPGEITVNVYNATKRTGLAKETADALKKRGFKIGKVGNAPAEYDKKVKAPGLLLGAPAAAEGAFDVLGTQLPGARTRHDAREGEDVDLIIGDDFRELARKKEADQALVALSRPAPKDSAADHC
ncbi:LytR C-terminal domain-containing protein [Streptomyces sp. XD-27]|uniref:LytR C-terminal domain-containing protein n=1 Tax=Streptomyces sp. XD-27 TaxID=3062779 RepID=UPI0026F4660B|nr:LytR C-terminal domain-containing protein [Streptomyces sp. XD-27]WKX71682.1 LytR C-terminal domain-containing protein [Streptomyces sp. XD-27]